uniref:Potassium voltage-gated channel subfamily H member 2-like n=1 Tax=Phascolarctos cinereus TaxID=38626 RepID=A0A6P5JG97_PHACI|nr:potassium voltage-gated channel subfamily H member 2-like [Phascolarctos cinereus]
MLPTLLPAAEDPHPANCSIPRRKRRRRKRRRRKRRRRQRHGSPGQRHAAKARQVGPSRERRGGWGRRVGSKDPPAHEPPRFEHSSSDRCRFGSPGDGTAPAPFECPRPPGSPSPGRKNEVLFRCHHRNFSHVDPASTDRDLKPLIG